MEFKVEDFNRLYDDPYGYYLVRKAKDLPDDLKECREIDRQLMTMRLYDKENLKAKTIDRAVSIYSSFWAKRRPGVDSAVIFRSTRRRVSYASDSCSGQLDKLIKMHNDKYLDEAICVETCTFRDYDVETWLRSVEDNAAVCYRRAYRIIELLTYFSGIGAASIMSKEDEENICHYLYSMLVASLLFDGDLLLGEKAANIILETPYQCELPRETFKGMSLHVNDVHSGRALIRGINAVVGDAFSCRTTFTCKDKARLTSQANRFACWDKKHTTQEAASIGCAFFDKIFDHCVEDK